MMANTLMVRDDAGAIKEANARGCVIPPLYEKIVTDVGHTFRLMFVGWRVVDTSTEETRGFVAVVPSVDGEDYEIFADGGWCVREAKKLFRYVFDECQQARVTARCKASNTRNIRALTRMGFREEGRKRLDDGDIIFLGMRRDECRLLKGA